MIQLKNKIVVIDMSENKAFTNSWSIWYHSNSVRDWSLKSYNKLHVIENLKDFWAFFNNLPPLDNGMFFVMREDIKPMWEAPENKDGGAWAIHVSPKRVQDFFINLVAEMLTGELVATEQDTICGLSVSPKFQGFSIKIWNNDVNKVESTEFVSKQIVENGLNYMKHSI